MRRPPISAGTTLRPATAHPAARTAAVTVAHAHAHAFTLTVTLAMAFTFSFALAPTPVSAQTRVTPTVSNFNHAWLAEASHTAESSLHEGRSRLGDLSTTHARLTYLGTLRLNESWSLLAGADAQLLSSRLPDGAPIPDSLGSVALKLGANWTLNPRWTLRAEVDPGIYSDFEDLSGDDFNAPFGLRATYAASTNVLWVLGLSVDPRGDIPVVGGPGVRWRFAPDWTLNLVLPRPRIEFAASRQLTLFAGGELKGGSYRVGERFGRDAGRPALDGETVSYREIRAGAGARYRIAPLLSISLDAGWTIDRRYHYENRHLLLNGDGAPYVQFGLLGVF